MKLCNMNDNMIIILGVYFSILFKKIEDIENLQYNDTIIIIKRQEEHQNPFPGILPIEIVIC